jgi:hypothetical protein
VTELFGVVNTLDERSGTIGVGSIFLGTGLKRKLAAGFIGVCTKGKIILGFHRADVDPSSAFWDPPMIGGISIPK